MKSNKNIGSIARSATLLSILTVFIKGIGFVKQAVISFYFGTTASMDSYLVVTDFLSEVGTMFFSSIAIALISVYDEERNELKKKNVFVSNTFSGLIIFALLLVAVVCIFARPVVFLLAPGFPDSLLSETANKLRIFSFLLVNICFSNICIGLLNAEKKFVVAKSIGLIQSGCIIIACILFEKTLGITALYYGFAVFYIIENVFLLINICRLFSFELHNPFRDPRVKKLIRLSIPLFISSAIVQINAMVDKAIASGLEEGSVSGMSYGSFVFSTIHSIIIASVTTVLYSYYSGFVADGNEEGIIVKTKSSLQLLVAILVPISLICCLNADDIIRLIYGRGSFDGRAISLTSGAFLGYSLGIVFIAIRDVYLQVIYAYQRTTIAMINGIIGVIINVFFSIVLSRYVGIFGIAVADSISYVALVFLSYYSMKLVMPRSNETIVKRDFFIVGVSTVITFVVGYVINIVFCEIHYFFRLVLCAIIVFVVYFFLMFLFKHESVLYVKRFIQRKDNQ